MRTTRGDLSIADYLDKVNALADTLALSGSPFNDDDLVAIIMNNVGPMYETTVASAQARDTPITYATLEALLLSAERRLQSLPPPGDTGATVLAATRGRGGSRGRGSFSPRGGRGFSGFSRGSFSRGSGSSSGFSPSFGRGLSSHAPGLLGATPSGSVSASSSGPPSFAAPGRVQCRVPAQRLTAYAAQSSAGIAASPGGSSSSHWLTDSGANSHITNDLSQLAHPREYRGTDNVNGVLGGTGLGILRVGTSYVSSPSSTYPLSHTLYCPNASANILSVHQFSKDNHCYFTFYPDFFRVQDLETGKILFQGRSDNGLYPFPVSSSSKLSNGVSAFLGVKVAGDTYRRDSHRNVLTFPSPAATDGNIGSANPSPPSPSAAASPSPVPPSPQVRESVSHPMLTRAKAGICKPNPKYAHLTAVTAHLVEPTCYSQAQKSEHWRKAMADEFNALQRAGTWTLTFSPVVNHSTIRLILAIAVHFGWSIRQLDVQNAFLHGSLTEDVYMKQPVGFLDSQYPTHVCKLNRSLYGLKQAPRAWFQCFSTHLEHLGFVASKADSSLFMYFHGSITIYLLIYVDDILVTGNSESHITQLILDLGRQFSMKDLGPLHYFLGMEVVRTSTGLYLSQSKYILDLLTRTKMLDCKPLPTPAVGGRRLSLHDGDLLSDVSEYRSVVGALQYLTYTRPDIAFSVNQVCQFMHKPTTTHWAAVKRILRYLKSTSDHGLVYKPGELRLTAYADADYAGDPDDRRSTGGYCIYLGNNLVSWSSKKQRGVSRSSTEAEYRQLAYTAATLSWVRSLFRDLRIPISPPRLWCDNVSAISLTSNPVFQSRSRHIELADLLTKGLSTLRFHYLLSKLPILCRPLSLQGRDKPIGQLPQS
ncbi:unnamed protein product [Prunus brigantina]